MSAEKGSSKADTLVKVVLVFFISLLSFSVGTFVGKQVSDSDHRRMALEGEYKADRSVASADDAGDASEAISDKEVESLTEEFVNKEKSREPAAAGDDHHAAASDDHAEAKVEPAAEPSGYKAYPRKGEKKDAKPEHKEAKAAPAHAPAHGAPAVESEHASPVPTASHAPASTPSPKADGPHAAAEKVAANKAPSDGMKEERKPNAVLPAVASSAVGKYTVQVASYAEENEAKNHAAGLKGKGWNAFYLPATVQGRTWYRVSVGLFNNDKSAKEFRAQFMKETSSKSALVQKIVQ